jgi:NAD(P)-dependent dehydrogenase (short-subunit alcohol dehydrogenase family)
LEKQVTQVRRPLLIRVASLTTSHPFHPSHTPDYAASKSGLTHGLLLSLKNEIVNVSPLARANCVAPGWVATRMAEESMKDERVRYQAMATCVGLVSLSLKSGSPATQRPR